MSRIPHLLLLFAFVWSGPLAVPAEGQYFGGNKVQYRTFDFRVLKTDHFDVHYYPEEEQAARIAARMAERWYARLSEIFQHEFPDRQPFILYASSPDFQQTNVVRSLIGEGTGGVTESFKRRIVMPMGSSLAETDHVLGHELVHAFQFDLTAAARGGGMPGALALPLWFVEGMAEYLSIGPVDPNTAMWLRDAVREERLPTVRDLADPRYFPYRWGHAFWAYVAGRWGDEVMAPILIAAGRAGNAQVGLETVLEIPMNELSEAWHAAILAEYEPFIREGRPAGEAGRLVVGGPGFGEDLNVSPAVSPDGGRFVFFSSRALLSVDLYLADARTGEVIRRIVDTAVDPHFSSLQFIRSAGTWSPEGRRLAFVAVTAGDPALVLYDVEADRIERQVPFPGLGEIINPAWSPDGRAIAFAASEGGLSNLYVYDLERDALQSLTDDPYADLQPAWSPDGRQIAFITERFTASLDSLALGPLRLAILDLQTGDIRPAMSEGADQQTNPQWSPDGNRLYFVSDRAGRFDVYRLDLASGGLEQVTDLATGVSGITPLSPALSVARESGDVLFTAYEADRHAIYALAPGETAAAAATAPSRAAAALPPRERAEGRVDLVALLADPAIGLPPSQEEVEPYRPRLSLDFVGQPYIAAGMDPFGRFVGGGLSLMFSDMLGDHSLVTVLETGSYFGGGFTDSLTNTTAIASYQNLRRRWNWGLAAEQVPFLSGSFERGVGEVDGSLVGIEQTRILRQNNRALYGLTSYPFSRAQRIEFSGGFQHLTFDEIVARQFFSLATGRFLGEETRVTSIPGTLNLGRASAALVYDTSLFGATSPISGQRYRFDVAPVVGTIRFASALADFRRYFMPVQLYTIAGRVIHYGRYGRDSEDARLNPLFIGYPGLVRGYDIGSFRVSECLPDGTSTCPAFDRLLGSRMLIGNLEFRFPLLRPFGLRHGLYGPVPIEVAFFGDAGVAWTQDVRPSIFGGDRAAVRSAGIAFRVNALGFAVIELDAVRPFDRPGRGWMFQFSLVPGF